MMGDTRISEYAKQLHTQFESLSIDKINDYIKMLDKAIKRAEDEFNDELYVQSQKEHIEKDSMFAPESNPMLQPVDYTPLIQASLLTYLKNKASKKLGQKQ